MALSPNDVQTVKLILQNNVALVNFTKVDGTRRVMKCTLLPEYLPPVEDKGDEEVKKPLTKKPDNIVTAYEIGLGWKSFKVETVNVIETASFVLTAKGDI